MTKTMTKRTALSLLAGAALLPSAAAYAQAQDQAQTQAEADDDVLSRDSVWHDPDIPVLGNPDGNLTVVEYFDYQCPICKVVHPGLSRAIREDGKVRLVSRSWPIFGGASVYAARIALAARYQGKFAQAHEALFVAKVPLSEKVIAGLLTKAGVDAARAVSDVEANRAAIDATLARNQIQAVSFGFLGTPAFIVGPFRVSGGLDAANFKKAFAAARAKQAGQ